MSDLKQKLATAKEDYDAARAHLEKMRSEFESGPKKEYTETQKNLSALQATIKENEKSLEDGKTNLAKELRASNGQTTDVAKKILSDRRNTDDVLEQCREILHEVEKSVSELRIPLTNAVRNYQLAYSKAAECWQVLNTYTVIAECGQRLCEALAVTPVKFTGNMIEGGASSLTIVDNSPTKTLILKELGLMLKEYKGDWQPYRAELGECNVEVYRDAMVTPGQKHNMRFGR
jgi:hypothetical protein